MKYRNAILFMLILVGTACQGRRFEPNWSISKLRLMGIQSSRPELRPNQTTTLTPIVWAPNEDEITYKWEWCPFTTQGTNNFECPMTQEELQSQIDENLPEGIPPGLITFADFDLGDGPTATLPYPAPQPILLGICQAIQQALADVDNEDIAGALPTFDCNDGFQISIRLIVESGGERIVAGKRVNLWISSEQEPDINPIVDEVQIRPEKDSDREYLIDLGHQWVQALEDDDADWYAMPDDELTPVAAGVPYEVRMIVDPDSVQTYAKRAPAGADEEFRDPKSEVLLFHYNSTHGDIENHDPIFVDGRNALETASVTQFTFRTDDISEEYEGLWGQPYDVDCPEAADSSSSTGCEESLWAIVRDDRLGIGWKRARFYVTDTKR